jgi:hypothetical protein
MPITNGKNGGRDGWVFGCARRMASCRLRDSHALALLALASVLFQSEYFRHIGNTTLCVANQAPYPLTGDSLT